MPEIILPRKWDHPNAAVMQPYNKIGGVAKISEHEVEKLIKRNIDTVYVTPRESKEAHPWHSQRSMSMGYSMTSDASVWGTEANYVHSPIVEMASEWDKYWRLLKTNLVIMEEGAINKPAMFVGVERGISQFFKPNENLVTMLCLHAKTTRDNLEKYKFLAPANDLLKMVDVSTVNCQENKELYEDVFDQVYELVPNSIDTKRFIPPSNPPKEGEVFETYGGVNFSDPNTVNILYLGRLEERKGVDTAIDAVNYIVKSERASSFKFVVAGSGSSEQELKQKVKDMGIEDVVRFVGIVPEVDKVKLIKSTDFCCFPAKYGESFGDVLLESWACGKPVIAGKAFSPNLVKQEDNGYLLKNDDPIELAEYMLMLIDKPGVITNMGKVAREMVLKYDSDIIIDKKLNLADEVRRAKAELAAKCGTVHYLSQIGRFSNGIVPIIMGGFQYKNGILSQEKKKTSIFSSQE